MKLNFNNLAKWAAVIIGSAAIFSCSDLNELEERIDDLDSRVTALEKQIPALNESVKAVSELIKEGAVITKIEYFGTDKIEDGEIPYYEITVSGETEPYKLVSGSIGNIPAIGINENGNWTMDGTEITVGGSAVSAEADAPEFRINNGYWEVKTDGEFEQVLDEAEKPVPATGTEGSDIFDEVVYDEAEGVLRITMSEGGKTIEVPVISADEFSCVIYYNDQPADYDTPIEFGLGGVETFSVKMTGVVSTIIEQPRGWQAELGDETGGTATLTVTAPSSIAQTKISASTENDITIHALNADGLSTFAKIQVKVLPGTKPVVTVSASEAGYTSLGFTVTCSNEAALDGTYSYKYLLYTEDTPAPSESTFGTAETGTETLSLTSTSDGQAISYGKNYVLYVLPVNTLEDGTAVNGDISATKAATKTAATYKELYDAGVAITIAGKTYDKTTYGEAGTLSGNITSLANEVNFVDGDIELNISGNIEGIILIGNNISEKPAVTFQAALKIAPQASSAFVLHNLELTNNGYDGVYYSQLATAATLEYICVDNCKVNLDKHILTIGTSDARTFTDVHISNSDFKVPEGQVEKYLIGANSGTRSANSVTIENNVFYSGAAGNNFFRLVFFPGMALTELNLRNNTFYNIEGHPNTDFYFRFNTVSTIDISNNLMYNEVINNGKKYSLLNCNSGTYPSQGTASNNYYYMEEGIVCDLFYVANYTSSIENTKRAGTDPLSVKDVENGIFTTSAEYPNCGAQR